ncbi:MAG TPA: RIP metalloprotease RseP [Gemmatimonadota bacterium]|jgi:regulator of sigma E protease
MVTILVTILVLGILVFVHELGHFVAAKLGGIQVPRFSIGLGPRLFGFRIGETDYCISAIPFGGYVKMAGMEADEAVSGLEGDPLLQDAGPRDVARVDSGSAAQDVAFDPERGFDRKPLWVRLVVILAGVFMNFVFGFLVFVWLSWSQGEPRLPTIVSDVDPEVALLDGRLEGWRGRAIRSVNGAPVDTWAQLDERLHAAPDGTPLRIGFADGEEVTLDPAVNGSELARGVAFGLPPVIGEVQRGSVAEAAGLGSGDRILALDGRPVVVWDDIPDYVRSRAGQPIRVRFERDETPGAPGGERTLEVEVVPGRQQEPGADNRFVQVGFLGVAAKLESDPISFPEAVRQGWHLTARAGGLILHGLGQLVTGKLSLRALGGPVVIGQITGYYRRQGIDQLLYWMALFSINLAILNLLPIPVLDGGHVLFLLIEGIRGHPLSPRFKVRLSQVGMVLLILLMAWAVTSDLLRLLER